MISDQLADRQLLLLTVVLFPLLDPLLSSPLTSPAAPCSPGLWARTTHRAGPFPRLHLSPARPCHLEKQHSGQARAGAGPDHLGSNLVFFGANHVNSLCLDVHIFKTELPAPRPPGVRR